MIFQATWRQVLDGSKTQTRRIVRMPPTWESPGRHYVCDLYLSEPDWSPANINRTDFPGVGVYKRTGRMGGWLNGDVCVEPEWADIPKWIVGKAYAVQPGRGQKAIGRIRITRIRQERVRDITEADAIAEGYDYIQNAYGDVVTPVEAYAALWDRLHDKPGERWADNPSVWVLEFELVEAA